MESVEEACLRRRTALRQHRQLGGGLFALQMRQNSLDYRRVFNASDNLDVPSNFSQRLACIEHHEVFQGGIQRSSEIINFPQ
jgi:hypothetical protein